MDRNISYRYFYSFAQGVLPIFSEASQGFWYDPSDFSTMFQDSAGTTPVTAAGQPVGKILDKSPFANHLTQATEANRPTLEVDSLGYYYLSYDGVNDLESATIDFSASDKLTLAASFKAAIVSDYSVMSLGAVTTETGTFDFGTYAGGAVLYRSGATPFGARATASLGASVVTVSATCDLAGATQATENPALRVDGSQFSLTDYGSGNTGGGNFGEYTFKLGGGLYQLDGRVYGAMGFDIILTTEQLEIVEAYLNSKSGLLAPSFYSETSEFEPATTYHYGSTFSHVDLSTSATDFVVAISSPVYDYYPQYAFVGVYVNDVYHSEIEATQAGMKEYSLTLDAGLKNIRLVHGLQTYNGGVWGTFVTSVRANAPMTQTQGLTAGRVVAYGDSITVGSDASPITQKAWAAQIQWLAEAYYSQSFAVEAWGGRSLHDDCVDGTARTAFVAKIESYNPSSFWMAIGTNDYGMNLWTAANFGTAYSATLDALHAAMPDLYIYCQTPILRGTETANGLGSTLGDYRTAIATAVSTRTSFCELVDGTAFMTLADIPDGVHPNTTGHELYATAVGAILTT
jgi:lysophospholipase L1-like esterase